MNQLKPIRLRESDGLQNTSVFKTWRQIFRGSLAARGEGGEDSFDGSAFFLLLGKRNSGKDPVARAFAFDARQAGYQVFAGIARDLQEELAGLDNAGFEECIREIASCRKAFLYVRRLDLMSRKKGKCRIFRLFLEKLKALPDSPVVIATACDERMVDEGILELFQICPLRAPDPLEAAAYFESKLDGKVLLAEGLTSQMLAEETKGYFFGQLQELTGNILRFVKAVKTEADRKDDGEKGGLPVLTKEIFSEMIRLVHHTDDAIQKPPIEAQTMADVLRLLRGASGGSGENISSPGKDKLNANSSGSSDFAAADEQAMTGSSGIHQPENPFEKLEASGKAMEEAGDMLLSVKDDIGKGAADYTDEELAEMGYEPEAELPEDEEALESLDAEGREALFTLLDF